MATTHLAVAVVGAALFLGTSSTPAGTPCELPSSLVALSCPSTTLCVAAEPDNRSVWVADPRAGGRWVANVIDGDSPPTGVACPSTSFCAAIDLSGDIATSTYPRNAKEPWKLAHLDGQVGQVPPSLFGISCPSSAFCAVIDTRGNVLTSTDPGGGPTAWRAASVDGGNLLNEIDCASSSLCIALDSKGYLLASSDPAGGAHTWVRTRVDGAPGNGFYGLACPSTSLCVAVDSKWNVLTSARPADPSTWHITGHISPSRIVTITPSAHSDPPVLASRDPSLGITNGATTTVGFVPTNALSCPSTSFCAITSYFSAQMFTSTDPASPGSTWTAAGIADPTDGVGSVSCPTPTFCVGSTANGYGVAQTNPALSTATWPRTIAPANQTSCPKPQITVSGASMSGAAQGAPSVSFTLSQPAYMLPFAGVLLTTFNFGTNNPDGLAFAGPGGVLAQGISVTSEDRPVKFTATMSADASGGNAIELTFQPSERTVTVHISSPLLAIDSALTAAARSHRQETVSVSVQGDDAAHGFDVADLLLPLK